jgi:hypothetical protein
MAVSRVSIPFKETGLDAITFAGRTRLGRVQRADINMNIPTTTVQELGSDKQVGKIFDLPEVSVTVSAIDVGARTAFILAGEDWATAASGSYVEAQDITYACLVETFKSQTTDDIARSLYVPGAKLSRLSFNYSVNGDATEEYTFDATDRRWLKYDVAVTSGVTSASGVITLSPAARLLKNGNYYLSAFASGTGYLTAESFSSSTTNNVTFDTTVVAPGTPVLVTYHADLSNQWDYTYEYPNVAPGYTPAPDQPIGVRGWGIEVYLVKSGQTNEKMYRGQTVTLQAQFPQTRINELGNQEAVGYTQGIPEVTGTFEALQHDFRLLEIMSGDDDSSDDNWEPDDLGSGDWGLEVRLWRRNADRINTQPEKTIYIPKLDITQENNGAQVGQDSRVTYNISSRDGKIYMFKGSRIGWHY